MPNEIRPEGEFYPINRPDYTAFHPQVSEVDALLHAAYVKQVAQDLRDLSVKQNIDHDALFEVKSEVKALDRKVDVLDHKVDALTIGVEKLEAVVNTNTQSTDALAKIFEDKMKMEIEEKKQAAERQVMADARRVRYEWFGVIFLVTVLIVLGKEGLPLLVKLIALLS
jgi:uncharacterized membrane protein